MPKKTILIVEDEPEIIKALKNKLSLVGFDVKTASDGNEGLRALTGGGIDFAVIDILMPEMDGLTMLRKYAEIPGHEKVPNFILTNVGEVNLTEDELKQLDIVGVIIKAEMRLSEVAKSVADAMGTS